MCSIPTTALESNSFPSPISWNKPNATYKLQTIGDAYLIDPYLETGVKLVKIPPVESHRKAKTSTKSDA